MCGDTQRETFRSLHVGLSFDSVTHFTETTDAGYIYSFRPFSLYTTASPC